jgi:hypothetical protein
MSHERTPEQEEAQGAYLSEVELQRQETQRQNDARTAAGRSIYADAEDLQRWAEAATAALEPIANAATERLHALAADLDKAEGEPLGLSTGQRQILRRTAQRLRGWADADTEAKPVGYLTRAQFARLAQVSANTLVKWHAAGSLVPAYTHPLTHYRYYKPEQVAEVRNARQRRQRKAAK